MTDEPKSPYDLFGVECGPGWRKIIEPLMNYCAEHGIAVIQVKEKFGGLRFYYGAWESPAQDATIKRLDEMITAAEHEAEQTCERCGAPGKLRQGGWLQTLCDDHAAGRETRDPVNSLRAKIVTRAEKQDD